MIKKISFSVKTDSENQTIDAYLMRWIKDNFRNSEGVKITIEEIKELEEVIKDEMPKV